MKWYTNNEHFNLATKEDKERNEPVTRPRGISNFETQPHLNFPATILAQSDGKPFQWDDKSQILHAPSHYETEWISD